MKFKSYTLGLAAALAMSASAAAFAHGGESHGAKPAIDYAQAEETAFGRAADPAKAKRTIAIDMHDSMRFSPDAITIKRGEIVRFRIKNQGQIMHEMVIGTERELAEHAETMRKYPDMEHDEPYMAHVAPGQSGEIGWQFTKPGEYRFACLLPGHSEAGMVGKVVVK